VAPDLNLPLLLCTLPFSVCLPATPQPHLHHSVSLLAGSWTQAVGLTGLPHTSRTQADMYALKAWDYLPCTTWTRK